MNKIKGQKFHCNKPLYGDKIDFSEAGAVKIILCTKQRVPLEKKMGFVFFFQNSKFTNFRGPL